MSLLGAAESSPDATSVITEAGSVSFFALAARAARLASALRAEGHLDPRTPVALSARATLPSLEVLHTLIAHAVPVLLLNPKTPAGERARLMERAGARALLEPDLHPLPDSLEPTPLPPPPDPAHTLAMVPTSGSGGEPKLVLLSHGAVRSSARASQENLPLGPGDAWLLCLPLSHVSGLSIVIRALFARAAVLPFAPGPQGLLSDLGALRARIEKKPVTVLSLVPAVLDALLDQEPPLVAPSRLRAVLLGGAATSPRLIARASARRIPVLTTYGLTEASSQVATLAPGEGPATSRGIVTSGRALPGVELREGPDGRLSVRGPMLFSGYAGTPSALDQDGFFVTDDLGHLDAEGRLFVTGRVGDRIVTGGENVDPVSVEATLLELPGVERAIVFGTPDAHFGEKIACALVTRPGFDAARALSDLRKLLLPHERPRRVALLKDLPVLPNGKLDRPRARALALESLADWTDGEPWATRR